MSQIIIGFTTEGNTDVRFLSSIIERTFVEVAFECETQIEIITPIIILEKEKGSFNDQVLTVSKKAYERGAMVVCIHVDADAENDNGVFVDRIKPAFEYVNNSFGGMCKNLVPLIPVQMTESWMLADKELLKEEIGTNTTDHHLGINRSPEAIANPKAIITEAIRIAREPLVKRRRRDLTISELYQPIGQKVFLDLLSNLGSFAKFKEGVREAYRFLSYL